MSRWVLAAGAAAVYLTMLGSLAVPDLVAAAVLGAALSAWSGRDALGHLTGRVQGMPRLLAGSAVAIVRGALQVLRVLLGLASSRNAGYVRVPRRERTEEGIFVTGLVMTMSPGTVFVRKEASGDELLFAGIDVSDPDAIRQDMDEFYERSQREAVP